MIDDLCGAEIAEFFNLGCGERAISGVYVTWYPNDDSSLRSVAKSNVQKTMNFGTFGFECSIRRPVEIYPWCSLSLVMDACGNASLIPSTHSLNSSELTTSFASGHVALKVDNRAPPNCEKVMLAPHPHAFEPRLLVG